MSDQYYSDTSQGSQDFDETFYRRVTRAASHTEFLDCRKIASRSRDERVLRAFVAAMFVSKMHRKEISSCIREYIGKRAISALLWNLSQLRPDRRMFQARLLCMLGHWEAFIVYYRATMELEPLDTNVTKSVEWFLTNHTPALLPGMRNSLSSDDAYFALFCAPYLYKYYPEEVSARLAGIARNSGAMELRIKALHLLTAFSPELAVNCLMERGGDYPLAVLISTLSQLATSEDGKHLLPGILDDFSRHDDERQMAATFFSPQMDDESRKLQYLWITGQLKNWVDTGAVGAPPILVQIVGQLLCQAHHPEWVGYLETAGRGGRITKFARNMLVASRHPAGLRLLRQEIESADRPENLFGPCIKAIQAYQEDALDVHERVVSTGNAKLRERIEQIVALTWPGKTIDQLLDERKRANKPPVHNDPAVLAESPPVRVLRRKERTTSSFDRDRGIADEVKEREEHCCQVCGRKLVNARNGNPYAESHHIHPLGHEGSDTIENLLCLCPLCHALFHLGCLGIDAGLRIHSSGAATEEKLITQLRLASGRCISRDALRYHWVSLFIPPEESLFDEKDPDDS